MNNRRQRCFASGNITVDFRKSETLLMKEDHPTCNLQKEQNVDVNIQNCPDNNSILCLESLPSNEDGAIVTTDGHVPFNVALLCCICPTLKSLLCSAYCMCDKLYIILPWVRKTTINALFEIILTGSATNLCEDEFQDVKNTITTLDLSIDITASVQSSGVNQASKRVMETYVTPCYDDDDVVSIASNEDGSSFVNAVHSCVFEKSNQMVHDLSNNHCCKSCSNNCSKVVEDWSPDVLDKVKSEISDTKIVKVKQNLLNHLRAQDNILLQTNKFQFNNHIFCSSYFSYMTGISKYLINTVLNDYWKGVRIYEHGNAGISKIQPSTVGFISWMKGFAEWYGQYSPTEEKIILSYWLRKGVLYSIYIEDAPGPHIASSTFYQYFETFFGPNRVDKSLPCVRISKYSSHSVCNICLALNNNRRQAKTELDLKIAKSLINQHKQTFGEAFRKVQEIKQAAISHPQDHLLLQVDGMNNFTSYVPRYQMLSKEMQGSERLASKITGCIMWSGLYEDKRKIVFYVNHDQVNISSALDK